MRILYLKAVRKGNAIADLNFLPKTGGVLNDCCVSDSEARGGFGQGWGWLALLLVLGHRIPGINST